MGKYFTKVGDSLHRGWYNLYAMCFVIYLHKERDFMDDLNRLADRLVEFRRQRQWERFHKPKDLALSICIEAAELLEHFQWKGDEQVRDYLDSEAIEEVKEEVADIAIYLLLFCRDNNIDLVDAINKKIEKNESRYPVDLCKGKADKYDKYIRK